MAVVGDFAAGAADQQESLRETIDDHADERAEQNGRQGLEQPDHGGFERGSGDGVDKPEQRELGHPIADLRDHLAPPDQREIAGQQMRRPLHVRASRPSADGPCVHTLSSLPVELPVSMGP